MWMTCGWTPLWLLALLALNVSYGKATSSGMLGSEINAVSPEVVDAEDDGNEKTVYACNGSPLILRCPNSGSRIQSIIKVTRANFGRFSIALCNEEGRTDWSVNCFTSKAKVAIAENCDNKSDCQVTATDFDLGPDPCPDTERYLEAHYVCIQKAVARPPDAPPWLSTDDHSSINRRRKPERRVPITAPPTTTIVATTTPSVGRIPATSNSILTTASAIDFTGKSVSSSASSSSYESVVVSAAPVFYENNRQENSEVEVPRDISSTDKSVSAGEVEDILCPSQNHRGLSWTETRVGTESRVSCPEPYKSTMAKWSCIRGSSSATSGSWANGWPDLSECRSHWSLRLASPGPDLTSWAESLLQNVSQKSLYGGDLVALVEAIFSATEKLRQETDADSQVDQFINLLSQEVGVKLMLSLGAMLDKQMCWNDLSNLDMKKQTLFRFLHVSRELGSIMASMNSEPSTDVTSSNLCLSTRTFLSTAATRAENEYDDGDLYQPIKVLLKFWPRRGGVSGGIGGHEYADYNSPRHSVISLSASVQLYFDPELKNGTSLHWSVLGLTHFDPIFYEQEQEHANLPQSIIVSLATGFDVVHQGRPILRRIVLEMPHENVPPNNGYICAGWSDKEKAFKQFCQRLKQNVTHTTCACSIQSGVLFNLWTYYSLLPVTDQQLLMFQEEKLNKNGPIMGEGSRNRDKSSSLEMHEDQLFSSNNLNDLATSTLIIIVTVSASLLVAIVLALGLLVVYCRRVKIRDKKWEDDESRPWYLRKSVTLPLDGNDYSELGPLQGTLNPGETLHRPDAILHPRTQMLHNSDHSAARTTHLSQQTMPMMLDSLEESCGPAGKSVLHSHSHYELARNTPQMLLQNQDYSAYYRSFRTIDSRHHHHQPPQHSATTKWSHWLLTKLRKKQQQPHTLNSRCSKGLHQFSNGGGGGGGSLALLARHNQLHHHHAATNNDGQMPPRRPFLDAHLRSAQSPTLSLRSEHLFLPDQFTACGRMTGMGEGAATFADQLEIPSSNQTPLHWSRRAVAVGSESFLEPDYSASLVPHSCYSGYEDSSLVGSWCPFWNGHHPDQSPFPASGPPPPLPPRSTSSGDVIYHLPLDSRNDVLQQQNAPPSSDFYFSNLADEPVQKLSSPLCRQLNGFPVQSNDISTNKMGGKRRRSSTTTNRGTPNAHHHIYMEVEDSGYMDESSDVTPSSSGTSTKHPGKTRSSPSSSALSDLSSCPSSLSTRNQRFTGAKNSKQSPNSIDQS